MLLQGNGSEQERFNGLPSRGGHGEQLLHGAGHPPQVVWEVITLQKLEGMQLYVAYFIGALFFVHIPENDKASFGRLGRRGLSSLYHQCLDLAAGTF